MIAVQRLWGVWPHSHSPHRGAPAPRTPRRSRTPPAAPRHRVVPDPCHTRIYAVDNPQPTAHRREGARGPSARAEISQKQNPERKAEHCTFTRKEIISHNNHIAYSSPTPRLLISGSALLRKNVRQCGVKLAEAPIRSLIESCMLRPGSSQACQSWGADVQMAGRQICLGRCGRGSGGNGSSCEDRSAHCRRVLRVRRYQNLLLEYIRKDLHDQLRARDAADECERLFLYRCQRVCVGPTRDPTTQLGLRRV